MHQPIISSACLLANDFRDPRNKVIIAVSGTFRFCMRLIPHSCKFDIFDTRVVFKRQCQVHLNSCRGITLFDPGLDAPVRVPHFCPHKLTDKVITEGDETQERKTICNTPLFQMSRWRRVDLARLVQKNSTGSEKKALVSVAPTGSLVAVSLPQPILQAESGQIMQMTLFG